MSGSMQELLNESYALGKIEINFPLLYRDYVLALRRCTLVERRFIVAAAENGGNIYDAAASIGQPKYMADRFIKRFNVYMAWQALDAIIVHRLGLTTARIITEFSRLALSDVTRLFNRDSGAMLPMNEWPADQCAALESIEVEELFYGQGEERRQIGVTKKVKFHKKQPALNALAKMRGLLNDKPNALVVKTPQETQPEKQQIGAGIDIESLTDEQKRVIASIPLRDHSG